MDHSGVHDLTLDLHHLLIVPSGPPARQGLCEKGGITEEKGGITERKGQQSRGRKGGKDDGDKMGP